MPQAAKAPVEPVEFTSPRAMIYMPGAGHPFAPGSTIKLHPDDVAVFEKSDLHLPFPEPEAEKEEAAPAKSAVPDLTPAPVAAEKAPAADKPKAKPAES